ncbi:hypothetical protein OKA04_20570 [Luteolibacter flavescens]|uniref:DUF1559 domain-containing protein n=1 Tax=Luteolibacter flavescens TaxID=1859460 RepID=A0ABT3FU97_9BACT|nr:hypothetical protein [Luteolibacter flavescens]MCW1887145.1 hypothetical protein [Luteolibacter flavescens]
MEPTLPPQPPPDVPAPPPGPEAEKSWNRMTSILLLGGICLLILTPFVLSRPPFKARKNADPVEASQNIRQVHIALLNFESEYGAFPDASTIPVVQSRTGTTLSLGNSSSNELFRQMFASVARTESIFWAKTAGSPRKPDHQLGSHTLTKGECGFTYIAGLSSSSDPFAPVAMAPVIPGTWEFDPKPFDGMAIILHVNGTSKFEPIDKNGHVMTGGMSIFDPRQPYWRGKGPDIKWPE